MRVLRIRATWFFVLTMAFMAVCPITYADQKDPQLNFLFSALRASTSKSQADTLQAEIWARWHKHPNDTFANEQLTKGIELMNSGQLKTAENIFTNVINHHPDFAEAWNKRATVRFFLKNDSGSIDDIIETIRLEPRHFGALSGLGMIRFKTKDFLGALQAYKAAYHINPHLPQVDKIIEELEKKLDGHAL